MGSWPGPNLQILAHDKIVHREPAADIDDYGTFNNEAVSAVDINCTGVPFVHVENQSTRAGLFHLRFAVSQELRTPTAPVPIGMKIQLVQLVGAVSFCRSVGREP